jgi:hypothetical protein
MSSSALESASSRLANDDPARIEAVRELSGRQGQQEHRHEFDEADEAEHERALRQVIDLPADADRLHEDRHPR